MGIVLLRTWVSRIAAQSSVLALFLALLPVVLGAEVPQRFKGKLSSCAVQGLDEQALCGNLPVWENRETRQGRKISIHVVVLPALASNPSPDPVFFFEGGPGDVGTNAVAEMGGLLKDLRSDRDIVFFDQRGVGASNGLMCDLPGSEKDLQGYLRDIFPIDSLKACLPRLQQKADLAHYNTVEAMDDVDEIREWLGYERINLYGISYGTLASMIYLRQHEPRVRSAVLMGVAPVNSRMPLRFARYAQTALDRVLDDCSADEQCRAAFPDARNELRSVLASLDAAPARAVIPHPKDGKPVELRIERRIFAATLRSMLYDATKYFKVPLYIHQAAKGNFGPVARQSVEYLKGAGTWSIATYLSVTCSEDVRLIDAGEVPDAVAGTFLGDDRIRQQVAACAFWPGRKLPDAYWNHVRSAVPVLILSGWLDPVTPPEEAAEVAQSLPNSLHLVARYAGHGPFGLQNESCEWRILSDFIKAGAPFDLDTSCLRTMHPPAFLLKEP